MILFCYYRFTSKDRVELKPDHVESCVKDHWLGPFKAVREGDKLSATCQAEFTEGRLEMMICNYVPPHGLGKLHGKYSEMFSVDTYDLSPKNQIF